MRERPGRDHSLLGVGDGRRLRGPHPDRQVAIAFALPQQDDGLVRGHLHADTEDIEILHVIYDTCRRRSRYPRIATVSRRAGRDTRLSAATVRP